MKIEVMLKQHDFCFPFGVFVYCAFSFSSAFIQCTRCHNPSISRCNTWLLTTIINSHYNLISNTVVNRYQEFPGKSVMSSRESLGSLGLVWVGFCLLFVYFNVAVLKMTDSLPFPCAICRKPRWLSDSSFTDRFLNTLILLFLHFY